MADEEDLLGSMDDLEDEEGEEEEGEGGSPLMKFLPLVGGVLVVQIVITYVIVSLICGSPVEGTAEGEGEGSAEDEVTAEILIDEQEVIWEGLDPIVINPAGTGGLRFASVDLTLGLTSSAVADAIEKFSLTSRIRDTLIGVLASKTIDQLDPQYHEALEAEMRSKLNEFMRSDNKTLAIKNIYFQGFVLQ